MLIWRGYGIFVVILAIAGHTASIMASEYILGSPLPLAYRPALQLTAMLVAAGLVYGLHVVIQRTNRPRIVIDKATGQELTLIEKHDLFFIPVKFWAYIIGMVGLFLISVN